MRHWFTKLICAAALVVPAAHAQVFSVTGFGSITETMPVDPMTGNWLLQANSNNYALSGIAGSWTLQSDFVFNVNTLFGSGVFSIAQGANSVTGTLSTQGANVALGSGFILDYTVTSGTGMFAGLVGGGNSFVRLTSNPNTLPVSYIEAGIMSLQPIPEPETALLLAGGLALLALRRMRSS
jgi:hypothetical protein